MTAGIHDVLQRAAPRCWRTARGLSEQVLEVLSPSDEALEPLLGPAHEVRMQ